MNLRGLILSSFIAVALAGPAWSQVQVGLSVGGGSDSFFLAIGDYFKVSAQQVQQCRQSRIPDEEMPVAFFIAQRANVVPEEVIELRAGGMSWMQVALHYRLNPRIFYVAVPSGTVAHTPYERAYGFYNNRHGKVKLTDADIVNCVDLKFVSEHYGYDPKEVIRLRAGGKSFREINDSYYRKKEEVHWDAKDPHKEKPVRRNWERRK